MNREFRIQINTNEFITGEIKNSEFKDKCVILCYGFSGEVSGPGDLFNVFIEKLAKENISSVVFDYRGYGKSSDLQYGYTLRSQTEDISTVVKFIKLEGYKKVGILGESFGGGSVLNAYTLPEVKSVIELIVFWYPDFDLSDDVSFASYLTEENFSLIEKQGYWVHESGLRIGKEFMEDIKTVNLYPKIKEIECPVLFLHGDSDLEVPYRQSLNGYNLAKQPKELHILKDANHCFFTKDWEKWVEKQEEACEITLSFLSKYF